MSARITDLRDFRRRSRLRLLRSQAESICVYHHLLREEAVSIDELARALEGTGLILRTDPQTGADIVRRDPRPTKPAA